MLGVEVGEEQADRDRLGAALARPRRRAAPARPRRAARPRPSGPTRSAASKRSSGLDQRRRLRRAEAVEVGPVLAGDLEQVGEALGRDQRRAGAAFLEQRVGADRHPVGEDLDRGGAAPARSSTASTARITPATGPPGWSAPSRCGSRRRRARTASVKVPPTSTPRSMGVSYRQLARPALRTRLGRVSPPAQRTMWMPSRSGSMPGKSVRRWPPRDSRRARAQVAIAAASG